MFYVFNIISTKIPASYFVSADKLILKFIWKPERPWIANTILKKSIVERLMLPNYTIYYKATVIKTMWYWHNNQTGQWDRIEPRNRHARLQSTDLWKGQKQFNRDSLSTNVVEQLAIPCKTMNYDRLFIPFTVALFITARNWESNQDVPQ